MKKITLLTSLLCGLVAFTACDDDRDSNPVVQQPTSFVLNEPALSGNVYDLEHSTYITVTCQQPDYGYTAVVTYYAQVSLTDTWVDAASEDDTATYSQLDGSYTECQMDLTASLINRAFLSLGNYTDEASFPSGSQTVYIRLKASLTSGYECYSNSISLNVLPYYMELSNADPELWYLVGGCIGDGSWSNSGTSDIGTGLIPMSIVDGYDYSATTGEGVLTFTGYFPASGTFKLIKTPGSWDDQWGNSGGDGIDSPVMNDGGSSNLQVPSDGYYTIELNTATDALSITAASSQTAYDHMYISGDFNSWSESEEMTAVNTVDGMINHIWKYTLDASSGDTTAKFLYDGWSPNWGAEDFPYGIGANNGANIPVTAGSYTVIFNDIDGYYHFFEK